MDTKACGHLTLDRAVGDYFYCERTPGHDGQHLPYEPDEQATTSRRS